MCTAVCICAPVQLCTTLNLTAHHLRPPLVPLQAAAHRLQQRLPPVVRWAGGGGVAFRPVPAQSRSPGSVQLALPAGAEPAPQPCPVELAGGAPEARTRCGPHLHHSASSAPTPAPAASPPSAFHFFHSHPWPLCTPCRRQFICSALLALISASPAPAPTRFHDLRTCQMQHRYAFPPHPVLRQPKKTKNLLGVYPGSPPDHPSAPPTVFVCCNPCARGRRWRCPGGTAARPCASTVCPAF